MKESLFEQLGGTYRQEGDYLIPNLTLSDEGNRPIGVWGQRHLSYIKQHRCVFYTELLIFGKLNDYLVDLNDKAEEMFSRLVKQMAAEEGITEQLKAENQMEWVGRMNNIRNCAQEIVENEIIHT